ncbi:MAG: alanine--tRNA ligase [Nanoarchaeota archaeon]
MGDKELKEEFKKTIAKKYEQFYPTLKLKSLGFFRHTCKTCKRQFWSQEEREVCGEPSCEGGYSFIGKKREDVDFIEVWKRFEKLFVKKGYASIKRYPSVARWNPTMDFTLASIADFQPYVVSGDVEAPAEKLIVPQTCIRFNDIDNVGITGRHYTGFTMIGQHAFLPKERFNQPELFEDYFEWYTKGMKLKPNDFVIHEDAWAGGGNYGPCLEFFSQGLEVGNQVYMMYEATPTGGKELKLKILDMGMGQERPSWLLSGSPTSYDVNFPTVCSHLFKTCGVKQDKRLMQAFIPYSGMLNIDEVDNIDETWKTIAKRIGYDVQTLKTNVLSSSALYSIGDHTRTLLYTIGDGALPGNVSGGYNLRVLYRRIQSFMEKYGWDIDLDKVIELHAKYLKPQYPELNEKKELVGNILAVEKRKYLQNKERNTALIKTLLEKKSEKEIMEKMPELYDSQGISPEELVTEGKKLGKEIKMPDNFYAQITERHEQAGTKKTQTKREEKLALESIPDTTILYYDKWNLIDFNAFVLRIIDTHIILDETAFYPTSGGQVHDVGTINNIPVVGVFKQGGIVIHTLSKKPTCKKGDKVSCHIDLDRRTQLAQHHTAAHILNGAAKKILGEHVWQAGAAKTPEKARLDITHYDNLTDDEIKKIEELANRIIKENRPIYKSFLDRNIAEHTHGFAIYQGGAVPGKKLRIVNIQDFDVEACGGTHLDVTGDVYKIKIIRTTKIQDGVIRIEFVAGEAANRHEGHEGGILTEITKLLNCTPEQIPGRAQELFTTWKEAGKRKKKGETIPPFQLTSTEEFSGDPLDEAARILKTQKEHVAKTIARFIADIEKMRHGSR